MDWCEGKKGKRGKGDKEVPRGSMVETRGPPTPTSKLHSRQAVSDYPRASARIRPDRSNFAISLLSRARIRNFKISGRGREKRTEELPGFGAFHRRIIPGVSYSRANPTTILRRTDRIATRVATRGRDGLFLFFFFLHARTLPEALSIEGDGWRSYMPQVK